MKLVLKNIVFTEIFKYFITPNFSLHSGYVFRIWQETRFLDITLDSKWNILSQSCFCILFSLLVWMYWLWIWKYIWTSHKNSFDTDYFTWKTGPWKEKGIERDGFHDVKFFWRIQLILLPKITWFWGHQDQSKSNSNNVFGYGTALLKISGHNSIEMFIFVVCWIQSFWRNKMPIHNSKISFYVEVVTIWNVQISVWTWYWKMLWK